MNRFKFDKIQIVGILFLVITLITGTAIARNRGFSLNPNSKAVIVGDGDNGSNTSTNAYNTDGSIRTSNNSGTTDLPVLPAGTKAYTDTNCGGNCANIGKTCTKYGKSTFYYCAVPGSAPVVVPDAPPAPPGTVVPPAAAPVPITRPVVRPTLTPALRTANGGYDFQTAKNDYAAPNTAGFDFKNGEISGYYKGNDGLYYIIGGTGNNPDNYIEERLRDLQTANSTINQEARIVERENDELIATAKEVEAAAKEALRQSIEKDNNLEQIRQSRDDQRIAEQLVQARVEQKDLMTTLLYNSSRSPQIDTNMQKCGSIYLKWEDNTCVPIDPDYIQKTEQLITEGKVTRDANWSATLPEYASCQNETDPAEKLACNTLKNGIEGTIYDYIPKAENYISSFQPDKVTTYWQSNYASRDMCIASLSGRGGGAGKCDSIIYTQDQITSSVALGVDMVNKGAMVYAPIQIGANEGMTTVAGVFKVIGGVTTLDQLGRTTNTCIQDPKSSECTKEAIYSALSVLNLDVNDALIAGRAGSAIYNTAVTAGNLISDAFQIRDGCKGIDSNPSDCLMAFGAISADVFFAGLDYRQGELFRLNKPADFEVIISKIPTPELQSGQRADVIDLVADPSNPNLFIDPLSLSNVSAESSDMLFYPRDAQTDLAEALTVSSRADAPRVDQNTPRTWVNDQVTGIMDAEIPTTPITRRIRESIAGLYEEVKSLTADFIYGPFRKNEGLANIDVAAPRVDEPGLSKADAIEPDAPVVKVDDNTSPSQQSGATTLAGNLSEGFENIAENGTKMWNDWVAGPVNRMVDDFVANAPIEAVRPKVVDITQTDVNTKSGGADDTKVNKGNVLPEYFILQAIPAGFLVADYYMEGKITDIITGTEENIYNSIIEFLSNAETNSVKSGKNITNVTNEIVIPIGPPIPSDRSDETQETMTDNDKKLYQDMVNNGLYAQIDEDLRNIKIPGGAGKEFYKIGCGQTAVANILCKYGTYCPSPLEVAEMIPLNEYDNGGTTPTQSNIEILKDDGFVLDPYTKSIQYNLTKYMEPNDVLWITGIVGGIPHHTYLDGYTIDSSGVPLYNLNDSYFGDGYKCKSSSDSSFACANENGDKINIGTENSNLYIIDTEYHE